MSTYLVAIHIIELIAALAGTYYYIKTRDYQMKIFVWYLWFVVFVETFGMYGYVLQNNYDNELFIWLKNSVLCYNTWLYNIFSFVSILLFGKFYKSIVKDDLSRLIIIYSVIAYVIFTILYFALSGTFFTKSLPYGVLLETLMVFIFVMLYYRYLLRSDKILYFYRLPLFYISSSLFLWYFCVTPLFIFDGFIYEINKSFIEFRNFYLFVVNILLYSCYTFAFLFTIQYKKQ